MKKQLLSLIAVVGCMMQANAQIALSKTLPPVGAKLTIYQAASTTLARPSSGADQVWDYSGVNPSLQFSLEVKALSSVAQSFQDSCPTAKYVEVLNIPGAPTPDHLPMEFFEDKGNYMVRVGQKGSNLNLEKKNDTLFVFNLAFGSSEVYSGSVREYSGYGTLKIGTDVYDSVVLVRSKSIVNTSSDTGYTFFRVTPYWTRLAAVMFSNGQSVGMSYWKPGTTTTTGLMETKQLSVPVVYPNPVSSILNVQFASADIHTICITDVQGKVVLSKAYTSSESINVDDLDKGFYILTGYSDEGSVFTKFCKQ